MKKIDIETLKQAYSGRGKTRKGIAHSVVVAILSFTGAGSEMAWGD
jgi:hypothetical protein